MTEDMLIQAYKEGKDIHRLTAAEMFNVSPEEVTDEQRSTAKHAYFLSLYGGKLSQINKD